MSENKDLAVVVEQPLTTHQPRGLSIFASPKNFDDAVRMATFLSNSSMIPDQYRSQYQDSNNKWVENPDAAGNCLVAIDMAARLRVSPLVIMQNVDMVRGRPGLRGTFTASLINACGLFTRLDYEWRGERRTDDWACRCVATRLSDGKVLEGTWITWAMVKAEEWLDKRGSKWKTMPEQMFMYRAASFWGRVFASDVTNGMYSSDELEDMVIDGQATVVSSLDSADELNRRLENESAKAPEEEATLKKKPPRKINPKDIQKGDSAKAPDEPAQAEPAKEAETPQSTFSME